MKRNDWVYLVGLIVVLAFALVQPKPQAQAGVGFPWYNRCIAVTTSDTVDLAPFTQSQLLTTMLYVGGAGNVTGVLNDGSTVLFTAPPVGTQLPVGLRRVNATATTATALVACYRL